MLHHLGGLAKAEADVRRKWPLQHSRFLSNQTERESKRR
uniref:Uncharacterized protein n=1 Tax=Arundo donax TaxID=35708 RepID=A0A0A8ZVZ4_ARUDO